MNKFKGFIKLSQEQYDTLKEQGSIEVKGKTFTYDPDNTIYIVKGESVQFTQEDQTKVNTIDISGDGSKFLSDDGVYKEIEGGIETLVGTEEKPINWYSDLEVGKLYILNGYATTYNTTAKHFIGTILALKEKEFEVVTFGAFQYDSATGPSISNAYGQCKLNIRSDGSIINSKPHVLLNKLNGTMGNANIYAPTSGGTAGQILQSSGSGAPTWVDMPSGETTTLVGTDDKPINFATDLEIGKVYTLEGKILYSEGRLISPITTNYPVVVIKISNSNLIAFSSHITNSTIIHRSHVNSYMGFDSTTGYVSSVKLCVSVASINDATAYNIPLSIHAPTEAGTAGQVLVSSGGGVGSNGRGNPPVWMDMPPTGPEYLNGTEETPINLYNDLEINKLYLISGVIYNSEDNLTANDSILTYKTNTNSLYLIGGKIDLITNELSFQPNYFTVAEIEATGEISTHQSSIAPVNSGTSGQVLTSNGPDQEPTWEDISTSNNSNTSALTADGAQLNFNAGDSTGTAHLVCNQNLYIGEETKDLSLDCDTFQLFTQDGWNWESTITDENGDDDTARFSFQMGNITLSNSNQGVHLNKATDQIILQASSVRGNTSTADLGTSDLPWNNIYGKTIYQNGQQVATKAEAALYKHNVSINGTNDVGQQINTRVVGLNKSNVLVTTYGQLINMITGAVDYPLSGYVYNEDNTFLGTILYFDYNMGNYFEFTVATPTGIEVIQLTTAQATISDTVAVVE